MNILYTHDLLTQYLCIFAIVPVWGRELKYQVYTELVTIELSLPTGQRELKWGQAISGQH